MKKSYFISNDDFVSVCDKGIRTILLVFSLLVLLASAANAQVTTVNLTTVGSNNWVVPAGVTSINVQVWGGGGAGGASSSNTNGGSGGGSGGYSATNNITVTPGQFIFYTIGAGGTAANVTTAASGTASSILGMTANGGNGGTRNTGSGATGGTATGGTVNTQGGTGGAGSNNPGGDGGDAPAGGGTGGNGGSNSNGSSGNAPGGGGGGGEYGPGTSRTGGNGARGQITITYTVPTISGFTPNNGCQNPATTVVINGTNFTGATSVTFNGLAAASFTVVSATQISAVVPSGATTGPIKVTTAGGFVSSAANFTINAQPSVAAITGSNTVCALGSIALSDATSGGIWASSNNAIATVSSSGVVTAGSTAGSVVISYTVTNASGCSTSATYAITVNPLPTTGGPSSVCVGSTIQSTPSSGGSWTLLTSPSIATITPSGLISGIAAGTATFRFTDSTSGCSTNKSVTVLAAPATSNPANQSVCSGSSASFSVAATGAGLTYQWYNGATPLSNGGNISGATAATLVINPVAVSDASNNYHVVVSGTCSPAATSADAALTVTERVAIVTQPASIQTVCENASVSFAVNATGAGLTYQWYNGSTPLTDGATISGATSSMLTINPVSVSSASSNYHVVVSGTSPCNPVDSNASALVVNVGPSITVQPAANQTVCAGGNVAFSVSATGGNLVYQWYNGSTALIDGPNISGATSATLTISNATPADTSSDYHVTVSNGCVTPAVSISAVLTVNEKPYIPNQAVSSCSEDAFDATPVNNVPNASTIVPAGTTYSWAAPVVTGGITGASAQTNQTSISQTLTNPTNTTQTATYTVTPVSGTQGNCAGAPFTVTVSVAPRPYVLNSSQTACSGTLFSYAPTNGGGNIVPAGTTYSWALPTLSGAISGATAGTGQASISQTLTNTTGAMQTATYTVTATSGSCIGSTFDVIFNVYPTPTVSGAPTTQTICSGNAITPIMLSNPNGVSGPIDYSWTRDNTANVTGIAASGFGTPISGTLTNTTNTPQTVTFTLVATSEYGCASNVPFTVSVIVNPRPTVAATPASQVVCSGIAIADINISNPNNVSGTVFSWTRSNTANLTGIADNGTSSVISGTLVNNTSVSQTTVFTITASANGCVSSTTIVSITVRPQPTVAATPSAQTLCSATAITPIVLSNPNAVAGTGYTWTRDNVGTVTGLAASGTGSTISGTLVNTTNAIVTVTFTITASSSGCASATTTAQVTLNPAPNMTVTPSAQSRCNNTAINAITFSNINNVAGTTYSWTRTNTTNITGLANSGTSAVITGTVTNNTSVAQTTVITMTATAPNGCATSLNASVTVYPTLSAPVISSSQTVCVLSTPGTLTQTTPVSGGNGTYAYQWQSSADGISWTNISGATSATYTPPFANLGTDNTFYHVVVASACGTVTSNSIYIEVVSNVGFTFDVNDGISGTNTVCSGTSFTPNISSVHFSGSSVRYAWSTNGTYITPASGGPVGTTSGVQLFVFRTSSANIGPLTATNNTNASVTVPVTITPSVYNYNGPPQGSGSFICSTTPEVINVTILPRPVATITSPAAGTTICSGTSAGITVIGNITDANMSYVVTRNVNSSVTSSVTFPYTTGSFAPGQAFVLPDVLTNTSSATHNITYTITPYSGGCAGTPVSITVIMAPRVIPGVIGTSQTLCSPADPAAFTETTAASGTGLTYQWYSSTTSATGPWTAISGATATTYDAPAGLTQTTWYVREVTSTVNGVPCTAVNTTPVVVTINNVSAGAIGSDVVVCSGDDPAAFTVTTPATASGTLSYFWEYSTVGCSGPWTTIASSNVAAYNPPVITQTTYYRRTTISTVGAQTCSATSNCVVITVNRIDGGTVGSDETLCGNNPSAFTVITPASGLGTLTYQWQSNTVGCGSATWNNIPGATSAVYDAPAGLSQTTYYRRVTTSTYNGVSCAALSNCITVTANSVTPGSIGSNQTICYGGDPAAFTVPVAATGTNLSYQWQISTTSASGPWSNISGATSSTYDAPGPITQITYFKRVVTGTTNSVSCSASSNSVTVFVNNATAPVMAGDQFFCSGENPAAFTIVTPASANGTLSYQWQSSTVGCSGPWTNISGATSATYDPPVLTQTTYYHVVVNSALNSVNCTAISNCITVTSNAKTWNGTNGTDWNNASNWTPNGVPTNSNCVVIPNVVNDPVISGSGYVAYAMNLTILNGGNLVVNANNSIEVTNFVNVNAGGNFDISDDASLVQIDNVANIGTAHIIRTTTPVYRYDYTYWNSPVTSASGYTLGNLSPATQFDKFYSWNPSVSGGNGNWVQEGTATLMNPAKGYIVRAPQTYSTNPANTVPYTATFTGTPNNGNLTAAVAIGSMPAAVVNDKLNLIGNPYPSALDADVFLADPTNATLLDGTLYFWTHHSPPGASFPDPFYGSFSSNYTASDYATYTTGMGGTATVPSGYGGTPPTGYVATGQSFFVKALASGNAVFNNSMRVRGNNNVFFRQANATVNAVPAFERHRFWLNLANAQGAFSQILLGYADGATNAKDRNFDGETFAGNAVTFYSTLDNTRLTVQGRALPFDMGDIIPLGYTSTISATFTIGIDHLDGLFENQNIYLEDKLLHVVHDLKASAYSFTSAAGTFNDRFQVRYTDAQLGTGNPQLPKGVVAYLSGKKLHAQASIAIKSIDVFDIGGKKIASYETDSNLFEANFLFSQGVYIAKITLSDESEYDVKLAQ